MSEKKKDATRYQCGTSKTNMLREEEGMKVKCTGQSWIAVKDTKCTIECDVGGPNYPEIICKNAGWRPTNEVKCEGVSSGVIIGALVGGIFGVVIIAVLIAKALQRQKIKAGGSSKVQKGKATTSTRRPGKEISSQNGQVDKPSSHYPRPQSGANSKTPWKNSSNKSNPPSYNELQRNQNTEVNPPKRSSERKTDSDQATHDRRARRGQRKSHYSSSQHGYDPGFQGYHEENQMPNVGYQNQAYYQGQVGGYGYPGQEPTIGYLAHPQVYPISRGDERQLSIPSNAQMA